MLIVRGFKVSTLWGLGMLFISPVNLLFIVFHFEEAQESVMVGIVGFCFMGGGLALSMALGG